MASRQRNLHSDYEDDLIIAAAMRAKADLLVTNDAKLCSHAPVAAMSVEDAKNYLATSARARQSEQGDVKEEGIGLLAMPDD